MHEESALRLSATAPPPPRATPHPETQNRGPPHTHSVTEGLMPACSSAVMRLRYQRTPAMLMGLPATPWGTMRGQAIDILQQQQQREKEEGFCQ